VSLGNLELDLEPGGPARRRGAAGLFFEKPPQKLYWGFGAELRTPDGYLVHLWDEKSMRERA
jgi:hypothetical protein